MIISSFKYHESEKSGRINAIVAPISAEINQSLAWSFNNSAESFKIREFKNKFIQSESSIIISIFTPLKEFYSK